MLCFMFVCFLPYFFPTSIISPPLLLLSTALFLKPFIALLSSFVSPHTFSPTQTSSSSLILLIPYPLLLPSSLSQVFLQMGSLNSPLPLSRLHTPQRTTRRPCDRRAVSSIQNRFHGHTQHFSRHCRSYTVNIIYERM